MEEGNAETAESPEAHVFSLHTKKIYDLAQLKMEEAEGKGGKGLGKR